MSTRLIIDIGNTAIKASIWNSENTLEKFKVFDEQTLVDFLKDRRFQKAILANSGECTQATMQVIQQSCENLVILGASTPLPFKNRYSTPQTLGRDRIAAVAGAIAEFANQNVLVIDLGTCITYDVYLNDKGYLGGAISPGMKMRFKAMHEFTHALPLVEETTHWNIIGDSTKSSMQTGVLQGILSEIEKYIEEIENKFGHIQVCFTGGDAKYFDTKLKTSIFVDSYLTSKGLLSILDYNCPE